MISMGNAKEIAETLLSLNKTLGKIQAKCDALTDATERLDERYRKLESSIVELKADVKVSSSETKTAAIEIATDTASKLVSSVHGPLVNEVAQLKASVDIVKTSVSEIVLPEEKPPTNKSTIESRP